MSSLHVANVINFNTDKCGVMHFGYNSIKRQCVLNKQEPKELTVERDLGVSIQSDLNFCARQHIC